MIDHPDRKLIRRFVLKPHIRPDELDIDKAFHPIGAGRIHIFMKNIWNILQDIQYHM